MRLGSGENGGIPLWAELKSYVGIAIDTNSNAIIFFAAHSRANTKFCKDKIVKALGLKIETTELKTIIDAEYNLENIEYELLKLSDQGCYGKVNPFNLDYIFKELTGNNVQLEQVHQLFDESLLLSGGYPNTVMSNLGDRRFAFELHPDDLINSIKKLSKNTTVTNISEPCPIWLGLEGTHKKDYWLQFPPPSGPKIGILTGNSPESGITLWEDSFSSSDGTFNGID